MFALVLFSVLVSVALGFVLYLSSASEHAGPRKLGGCRVQNLGQRLFTAS